MTESFAGPAAAGIGTTKPAADEAPEHYLLSRPEETQLQTWLGAERATEAAIWLRLNLGLDLVDIRKNLDRLQAGASQTVNELQLAVAARDAGRKRLRLMLAIPLVVLLLGWLLLGVTPLMQWLWPAVLMGLLAAYIFSNPVGNSAALCFFGIVLIPVTGVLATALPGTAEGFSIYGMPGIVLCAACLGFGMADGILLQRDRPGAERQEEVLARRKSRQWARLVLLVYMLTPILALNSLIIEQGVLDEDNFNRLFRFCLYLIVAAPMTVLFCLPLTRSLSASVFALATPLAIGAWQLFSGHPSAASAFLGEAALIQILAVYMTIAGGLMTLLADKDGRRELRIRRWLYLILVVGALLALGASLSLWDALLQWQPERSARSWSLALLLPAALIAMEAIRRRQFSFGLDPAIARAGATMPK